MPRDRKRSNGLKTQADSERAAWPTGRGRGPRADPDGKHEVLFRPVEQLRAHEYVAEQIRRHISLRLVPTGHPLPPDRDLAKMFGVGRGTVQAALRLLEADRLVETRRGRTGGTFVVGAGQSDVAMDHLLMDIRRRRNQIADAIDYRNAIEPAVAGRAAAARTKRDLERVERALRQTVAAGTEPEYNQFDTEFHLAIAAASHNRLFQDAVESIRLMLNDAILAMPESELWHERIDREHRAVLSAIERKDQAAASGAMREHTDHSGEGLRALLAALCRS